MGESLADMSWDRAAGCAVAVALVATAGVATAKPRLVVTAPDTVVGDGSSAVDIVVRVEPASAVAQVQGIEVQVSAGTVGDAKPAGNDGVAYPFTPPRLAADTKISVVVVARMGRVRLQNKLSLAATAPTAKVPIRQTSGAFDLRTPERVRLGRDAAVDISIARPKGPAPSLYVNVGSLSEWSDGREGRAAAGDHRGGLRRPRDRRLGAGSPRRPGQAQSAQ